jgi:hypothetical protein
MVSLLLSAPDFRVRLGFHLRERDSNPRLRRMRPACCRYSIPPLTRHNGCRPRLQSNLSAKGGCGVSRARRRAGCSARRRQQMKSAARGARPRAARDSLALRSDGDQPPTARLREDPAWLSIRYLRRRAVRCNPGEEPRLRLFHIWNPMNARAGTAPPSSSPVPRRSAPGQAHARADRNGGLRRGSNDTPELEAL